MFLSRKNSPRWVVYILDLLICFVSIILAYLLRFNFIIPPDSLAALKYIIPIVLVVRGVSFLVGKTYSGIVRYTSLKDAERILIVTSIGSFIFVILNYIFRNYITGNHLIPFSIIVIDFITTAYLMTTLRLLVKFVYHEFSQSAKAKLPVIIYGTKELAVLTKRALELDNENNYKVVAFLDHVRKSTGNKLEGVNICHVDSFEQIIEKFGVKQLIFAKKATISNEIKNSLVEKCLEQNIKVFTVPTFRSWINGGLNVKQIKNIKIEDLLERDPIILDKKQVALNLNGKTIMITGAAGSIGSEIVRQVSKFDVRKIILLDQAETPMYDMELEMACLNDPDKFEIVVGDITNKDRMQALFEKFNPEIVYHAAAYKHVPIMESHPLEAINNNVFGTKIIADLAVKYNVLKFIMVSTDKAVNPTNVMGASKRIAEIYIQALNSLTETAFITTRFGNVLGSNGSVIPLFKKQIERGGPVSVTHPEVTRYFMTIPEACQLVLEASSMGHGGEIFVFDMGKCVKVLDVAKKMIRLAGLEPHKDIEIKYIGLRPGEKLYEELLHNTEDHILTHHPKIMIAKVRKSVFSQVSEKINALVFPLKAQDSYQVVKLMKEIVPEYKSHNSEFEKIDLQISASNQLHLKS